MTYVALVIGGLICVALEVFLPGGIIGVIGFACLVYACVLAYQTSVILGTLSLVGLLVVSVAFVYFWLTYLPKSKIGKILTLDDKIDENSSHDRSELLGREGLTESELRPSGIVIIDGKRVDVVAASSWIDKGARVRVIQVEGFRVVVRELQPETDGPLVAEMSSEEPQEESAPEGPP